MLWWGKRRAPLWARLGVVFGSLLLVPAGGALVAARAGLAGHSPAQAIPAGALNLLLVGIDPRGTHIAPLADTIIVAHIPADRRAAYLFSLPRDLVVRIPAFPPTGTPATRGKINGAMALGSRTSTGEYRPAQGYELLARTVGDVTGIRRFDAGAIINFGGFRKVVDVMGGVRMVIDQTVVSEHRKPDGSPRDRLPSCQAHQKCLRPYTGPQKVYSPSDRPVRLEGWEALDYVRQRYGLPRSDYDRQRHQRQFLRAVVKRLSQDPGMLLKVAGAAGDSLTFVGGGRTIADWATALKRIDANDMTTVGLPGQALFEGGTYRGERFPVRVGAFFTAVAEGRVAQFLLDHPGMVTLDR
ncbi:LCP family protein [Actinoplanes aureus]|uniref:LCP family protein n=1 Tax=Actinoplanes aureus TaxID=2792083 RepID=A0A931G3A9_9ACTN|nr:LCP family protein [Actinoplanes aureus]MBG0564089.1 LCP family protein [Actinoplanes aureus]